MIGAKNHAIVLPDANKEQTLNNLLGASFGAAGQRCMALPVLILLGKAQTWLPELIERAKNLKINGGVEPETDIGPVVSCSALDRISGLIAKDVEKGATLALDGRNPHVPGYEDGNFIGPTVFTHVTQDMTVYREEIFGPVLCVLNADNLDDVIEMINANPNGNGTALFTRSGASARRFQEGIDVGLVGINVPIPVPIFSFSGSRASRLGDLGPCGKQVVLFCTQTKTVIQRWFDEDEEAGPVNTTITLK